jgi:hypothetical protein
MNDNYLLVDLDDTLCYGVAWTPEECLKCEPRLDVIAKVNELYKTKLIIIYTARQDNLYESSVKWLKDNGVKFHAVNFGTKVPGVLFDLDVINKLEDL